MRKKKWLIKVVEEPKAETTEPAAEVAVECPEEQKKARFLAKVKAEMAKIRRFQSAFTVGSHGSTRLDRA